VTLTITFVIITIDYSYSFIMQKAETIKHLS